MKWMGWTNKYGICTYAVYLTSKIARESFRNSCMQRNSHKGHAAKEKRVRETEREREKMYTKLSYTWQWEYFSHGWCKWE